MSMRVIDLDRVTIDTEKKLVVDANHSHLNNIGNLELGKKVKAMTLEEQIVVARNLPVDVMLGAILDEFKRFNALEEKLDDMLKRFGK